MGHPREKNKFKDRTLRTEGCGTPTEKEKAKFPESGAKAPRLHIRVHMRVACAQSEGAEESIDIRGVGAYCRRTLVGAPGASPFFQLTQ
jgi:hypothetical protein